MVYIGVSIAIGIGCIAFLVKIISNACKKGMFNKKKAPDDVDSSEDEEQPKK